MPQTVIHKGQTHAFANGVIPGNVEVVTNHPATGNFAYTLAGQGPFNVPLPGGQVFGIVLQPNGNTLTVTNNTSSGVSCIY